jgi:hypothetical protein
VLYLHLVLIVQRAWPTRTIGFHPSCPFITAYPPHIFVSQVAHLSLLPVSQFRPLDLTIIIGQTTIKLNDSMETSRCLHG